MTNVHEISPGELWVLDEPLRFYGVELGRRMTVIRLPSGELFVHSPSRLDEPTRAWLAGLGEPSYFVCPNPIHDAHIERPFACFPDARVYAPPGTSTEFDDLPFAGMLGDEPEPAWAGTIEQVLFRGLPLITEAEFFHPSSRTLILTDVCFNIGRDAPLGTRLLGRLLGMYGRPAVPLDMRLSLRDRKTARQSVERILAWDFDRVIVGHGAIVETGGRAAIRRAFDWLF